MLTKKFFLSAFILLALFKSAYIGIFTQYFDLESTNIAYITRIVIIVFGIILFFSQGKKVIHKNYFYIMLLFLMIFMVIVFQLHLDPKIYSVKNEFVFGFASFIIAVVSVLFVRYENLNNLSKSIFYLLIIFSATALFIGVDEPNNRLELKSLNPILIGYFAGMLVIISLWRMFCTKDKKLILFAGFIIGLWLLFAANSKGPILGVLLSMLLFLFNKNKKYYLLTIFLCLFLLFFSLFDLDFKNSRIFNYQDHVRMEIYQSYFEAILRNPILPLMDPYYNLIYAHNIFLAIYSGAGIFGLLIFLYLVYFALRASFKLVHQNTPYGCFGLFFILTLTNSLVSGSILDESFWMMLALVNVFYIKQRKNI